MKRGIIRTRLKSTEEEETMAGELVLPPDPIRFFDGLLCPLCSNEYVGLPFGHISTRHNSARLFDIPTECAQERLLGLVLYPDAPSVFYFQPDRCLVRGESNFHCAVCHRQAERLGNFDTLGTLAGNIRRFRYHCSNCRNEAKLRVIVRRLAEDPLPDVVLAPDRPPRVAMLSGIPTTNEILDIHETLAGLLTVNFGVIQESPLGKPR